METGKEKDREICKEKELEVLMETSEQALEELTSTPYNENALRYFLGLAKKVKNGEKLFPISGSREFFSIDREKELQYLISHYVMYNFDKKDKSGEYYGLSKALEWYKNGEVDRKPKEGPGFVFEKEEAEGYLLFSKEKWEQIKSQISVSKRKSGQYEEIKEIASRRGIEELYRLWDMTWNGKEMKECREWYSDTSMGITLQAPEKAAYAYLGFQNTTADDRQTAFHIKNIRFARANGKSDELEKENGVRLDPEHAEWQSKESVAVTPGQMYTVHFQVNQYRKLKAGIVMYVQFCDEAGQPVGRFEYCYNRKAWYPAIFGLGLESQCNAICYGVTGEEQYAEKAIYEMLLFMDDFCQGAAYWQIYNGRPEGRDNYGAVQAGRDLCAIAQTYAFVKDAGCWKTGQREIFVKMAEFILNDVFDLRDRTCLTPERAQRDTGNWQTDMCIGAAMIAAAVKEIPYRRQWIINAEAVLSAQLQFALNKDGSWPESLRYHHAALEHFCTFSIFWESQTRKPWEYKASLDEMCRYSISVQMPPYEYFGGRIGTPPFGDHRLSGGTEYQVLGLWAEQAAKTDPQLAANMLETWERAGSPCYGFWTEGMAVENLMLAEKETLPLPEPDGRYFRESKAFPDAGIYIFRKEEEENHAVLAVMANEKRIGHGHRDQGSFLYYYNDTPLIMDSGIESYFDASTQWHISSYSHACMQFEFQQEAGQASQEPGAINLSAGSFSNRKGWCDTPGTVKVLDCQIGGQKEKIQMRIENPEGHGYHIRTITIEKPEEIVICDAVQDFEGELLFTLPLLAQEAQLSSSKAESGLICTATGFYGVALKIESLLPLKKAWIEPGRVTAMHPGAEQGRQIPYLRMVSDAKTGFQIVLKAYKTKN